MAADCGYSRNVVSPADDGRLSDARRERLDRRQPAALALNEHGDSVCAHVHDVCPPNSGGCASYLYLKGTRRPLPVSKDGLIEIRFESPVSEFEPTFPESCGPPRDVARIGDGRAWQFKLPPDLRATDCFSAVFSFDSTYAATGTFADYRAGYGLSVEVTDERTFDGGPPTPEPARTAELSDRCTPGKIVDQGYGSSLVPVVIRRLGGAAEVDAVDALEHVHAMVRICERDDLTIGEALERARSRGAD